MSGKALPDIIAPRPRILFVGINPGLRSAALGHHFAGRGNPFWRLLAAAKLTPRVIPFEEDRTLVEHGLALTNLCPRPTRSSSELGREELLAGARTLRRKVARWKPRTVALVGLTLYKVIFAKPAKPGLAPETLSGARVFVLPNPSGLNASFPGFAEKLVWFRALATVESSASPRKTSGA